MISTSVPTSRNDHGLILSRVYATVALAEQLYSQCVKGCMMDVVMNYMQTSCVPATHRDANTHTHTHTHTHFRECHHATVCSTDARLMRVVVRHRKAMRVRLVTFRAEGRVRRSYGRTRQSLPQTPVATSPEGKICDQTQTLII